jgi:gliding motility-associated-like protein
VKLKFLTFGLFIIVLATGKTRASHCAGGELVYEWVSDSTYRFYFKFYRYCGGVSEQTTQNLCIINTCTQKQYTLIMPKISSLPGGTPNGTEVSTGCPGFPTECTSISSILPGYREWWYSATFTLPAMCTNWVFTASASARNISQNVSGGSLRLEATLDNVNAPGNSSPFFSVKPVPYTCINQSYTYNNGVIDVDKDSLSFEAIMPLDGTCTTATTCIFEVKTPSLVFPSNPFQTNNTFTINSGTGNLSFIPAELGAQTISIRAKEYRRGVLVGTVMRDVQIQVLSCSSAIITSRLDTTSLVNAQYNNGIIEACILRPFSFCYDFKAKDTSDILVARDNHIIAAAGSSTAYTGQATDSIRGCFSWTPGINDTGLKILTVTVKDSTCRAPGISVAQTYTFPIYINSYAPPPTVTSPVTYCQFDNAISLKAVGSGLIWYTSIPNDSGSSSPPTPSTGVPGSTNYFVKQIVKGCISAPSGIIVIVHSRAHGGIESVSEKEVCAGDTVQLQATEGKSFTYEWAPQNAIIGINNTAHISAIVASNTAFYLTIANGSPCTVADTEYVYVSQCCEVLFPDAFTPNGDGKNDKFRLLNPGNHVIHTFLIANRWGAIVYESSDAATGWDGTNNGEPQDTDTYCYYLKYLCNGKETMEEKGNFILIR